MPVKLFTPRDTRASMLLVSTDSATGTRAIDDLERLYHRHGAEIRQALSRLAPDLDADDLLQEVFLTAVRKVDDFARSDHGLAWLYGVAVKIAANRRKTARLRKLLGLRRPDAETVVVDSPARTREQRDAQVMLARALETLSAAKREVFVLFELQGLSGEQIAAAMEIPVKTVWTRLFHARREVATAVDASLQAEARRSGLDVTELKP